MATVIRGYLGDITPVPGKKLKVRMVRLVPHAPFDPENPVYDEVTVKEVLSPYHLMLLRGKRVKITVEETDQED
jgi:hypothetical protein